MKSAISYAARISDIRKNPYLLQFYAKKSCKKCYGRGYLTFNSIDTNQDSVVLCQCVKKIIAKESDG